MSSEGKKKYDNCVICCKNVIMSSQVTCSYCNFSCCRSCIKTYLLESKNINPHCMNPECGKNWTHEFLAENTNLNFHNKEYREHCSRIIMEMERSLLPGTQELAIRHKNRQKYNDEISELVDVISVYKRLIIETKNKIKSICNKRDGIEEKKESLNDTTPKVLGHCPNEKCEGFLMTGYVCGMCEKHACSLCLKSKNGKNDKDHVCDKDDVATAVLLKQSTKPCPGCSVLIYKISGCSQMFCTKCHVIFDWNTMIIQSDGPLHNPHWYEYQKHISGEIPRDVRVARCGGLIEYREFINKLRYFREDKNCGLDQAYRSVHHIRQVILPRYPNRVGIQDGTNLRVQYLCKEITEKQWFLKIKTNEKKREKSRSICLVLTMYIDVLTDIINNIFDSVSVDQIKRYIDDMNKLRLYVNNELERIKKRFNNKTPFIDEDFVINMPGDKKVRR